MDGEDFILYTRWVVDQMKWLFWFGFFAITSSSTLAQLQHGTVGVVYFTKDKVIVAADSRVLVRGRSPADTACKIATPRGQMVFVSANVMSYTNGGIGDFVDSWSNNDEIHRAYDTASLLYATRHDRIVGTAFEWGKSISSHFESLLLSHPEKIDEIVGKNEVLTIAEIAGLDNDGTFILFQIRIFFKKGVSPAIFPEVRQILDCPKSFCAIGEVGIKDEFCNLASKRAKKEAKKWKPPKKSSPADYDILRTKRLVELTIQYHDDDVGGPVDAVQLDRDGTVRWIAPKENCQKD
jgi:hypothetical protein